MVEGRAREHQTATLLGDGDVLIAGGYNGFGPGGGSNTTIGTDQLLDPATGKWLEAAPMLVARSGQTATLLRDGEVLVVGGSETPEDKEGTKTAELYDPATNTWEYTGPVLTGNEHTATLLPEGGVLVTGGNVSPISMYELSSAEIYAARYPPDEPPSSPVVTAVSAPPSIGHLAESHKRWREGPASARISARKSKLKRAATPLGTTFTFTLNEQATVTFRFAQQLPGRRVKGRCAAPSRNNRHRRACKRTVTRGSLTFTGHAGPNTVSFQGRLARSQEAREMSFHDRSGRGMRWARSYGCVSSRRGWRK